MSLYQIPNPASKVKSIITDQPAPVSSMFDKSTTKPSYSKDLVSTLHNSGSTHSTFSSLSASYTPNDRGPSLSKTLSSLPPQLSTSNRLSLSNSMKPIGGDSSAPRKFTMMDRIIDSPDETYSPLVSSRRSGLSKSYSLPTAKDDEDTIAGKNHILKLDKHIQLFKKTITGSWK